MNAKLVFGLGLLALVLAVPTAVAQDTGGASDSPFAGVGGIAIGAGLAIGLAGLGTGIAQRDIGAAAVGATAENDGFLGKSLIYVAIPETIVIFGLLIAFQLVGKIP
ncbi:MAG TPA: F0F1 ATP synthase subunit C [Candidatus Thermoplasmatota archaeon]|nr:F0F1 ATP synthase subunit C [Candidatus Thermoplasmatota archaeon]